MKIFKYITGHLLHFAFASIVSMVVLYLYEKSTPVSDYFTYYGNVTTQSDFHYPESLTSYTFGYSDEPIELDFVNSLWCTPIDSPLSPELVDIRTKHYDSFTFANILPEKIFVAAIETRGTLSYIGRNQAKTIRSNGVDYLSWSMGSIRPYEHSSCHISAQATTYSTIFRFPKTIRFNGNGFNYWTTLRPVGDVYVSPYSEWLKAQSQEYIDDLTTSSPTGEPLQH